VGQLHPETNQTVNQHQLQAEKPTKIAAISPGGVTQHARSRYIATAIKKNSPANPAEGSMSVSARGGIRFLLSGTDQKRQRHRQTQPALSMQRPDQRQGRRGENFGRAAVGDPAAVALNSRRPPT
jgi:hypothetical protein